MSQFVGVIIGASVSILGWIVTNISYERRDKRANKRKARAEFRAGIINALPGIYPICIKDINYIDSSLRKAFPEMQRCVEIYKNQISSSEAEDVRKSWDNYRLSGNKNRKETMIFDKYMSFSGEKDPEGNLRRAIDRLINSGVKDHDC